MDELYEAKDFKKIDIIKKVIDDLDMFSNDISFSKIGERYPRFLKRLSLMKKMKENVKQTFAERMVRILHFNKLILDNIEDLTNCIKKITDNVVDYDEVDLKKEIRKIERNMSDAKNQFLKRDDLIKGLKVLLFGE